MSEHYDYHSGLERVKEEAKQGEEVIKRGKVLNALLGLTLMKNGLVSMDAVLTVIKYLEPAQPDNQVHLCDSCSYTYPECPSVYTDVIFGNGIGNDNICACNKYEPSAQPERTCVNCGRTMNNGGWYADGRTRCPIEEHYALPKDGYCHLWEKRNVTDDDYPERREE